ncbi:hypothetical protein BCR33DRAFT_741132 [Rhizoclosmatium globosum]|uniref:Uncharacterized protein n=1 Tax=Rhizoclosmatium globosum TaxID=329046 RepID=A0A1Y2BWB7_9FUNG|nr:hypothetical protein BCR33DRAFT_741132 [Rhizoclosmatium globosum]|eukprot:ORY39033.1 hypothetical protein BCR33DRAFT_741132 [Rhizoclosmatium globosum]
MYSCLTAPIIIAFFATFVAGAPIEIVAHQVKRGDVTHVPYVVTHVVHKTHVKTSSPPTIPSSSTTTTQEPPTTSTTTTTTCPVETEYVTVYDDEIQVVPTSAVAPVTPTYFSLQNLDIPGTCVDVERSDPERTILFDTECSQNPTKFTTLEDGTITDGKGNCINSCTAYPTLFQPCKSISSTCVKIKFDVKTGWLGDGKTLCYQIVDGWMGPFLQPGGCGDAGGKFQVFTGLVPA